MYLGEQEVFHYWIVHISCISMMGEDNGEVNH